MKIGILYPRSGAHPAISLDYMDGIKTYLSDNNLSEQFTLIAENAGYGGVDKEVKEKIEKLLIIEDVDVLVIYIDQKILQLLKPILKASGKLIIVVSPGADYPQTWEPEPNIIQLNLNHAFLCWLTGQLAVKEQDTPAIMATSFYDCGYLHSAMMVSNFVLQGGQIKFNYVSNQLYNDNFQINELSGYLSADKETNHLLCIFDALPASLFYRNLKAIPEANRLHLFVSPMMLESLALQELNAGYQFSIDGFSPWMNSLENESNKKFIETMNRQHNKLPTIFSLQGWETAMLLEEVLQSKINHRNGNEVVKQLINTKLDTPRGELKLDKNTQWWLAPVLKCSIPENSVHLNKEIIYEIESDWINFVSNPPRGVVSGWTNTYLCY